MFLCVYVCNLFLVYLTTSFILQSKSAPCGALHRHPSIHPSIHPSSMSADPHLGLRGLLEPHPAVKGPEGGSTRGGFVLFISCTRICPDSLVVVG